MATKNQSKNQSGQSFRLTKSGWASQNVLPFWLEGQEGLKSKQPESSASDCLYAGGLNIRVPGDKKEDVGASSSKVVQAVAHDHTYCKGASVITVTKRKKAKAPTGVDTLVMRALADVPKEKISREEVSDDIKNTQLYKCLVSPIENRRATGEAFGHTMVKDIIQSAGPGKKTVPSAVGVRQGPFVAPPLSLAQSPPRAQISTPRELPMNPKPGFQDPYFQFQAPPPQPYAYMNPYGQPYHHYNYSVPAHQPNFDPHPHGYYPFGFTSLDTIPDQMFPAQSFEAHTQGHYPMGYTELLDNLPDPMFPPPSFGDVNQKYWTEQQRFECDLSWQQHSSCHYAHCQRE